MYRSVFISHSEADKPFVRRLADDLRASRVAVWLDETAIASGDSLIGAIAMALAESDCVIAVLSPDAVASSWVEKELHIALTREVKGQSMKVIPLLHRECNIPVYLIDKAYADFRDDGRYRENLAGLLGALGVRDSASIPHQDTDYRLQSALVSAEMLLHEMAGGAPPDPRNLERLTALVTRARILADQLAALEWLVSDDRPPVVFPAEIDLTRLIHDVGRSFGPFARARRLSLAFSPADRPMRMQTDRALLELILYQLLDNAVKYSYEGTTIFVNVGRTTSGMRISVSNEGVRIAPDETRSIFERGYRGSRAMATAESGAGIGLFLANQAAKALGGRISIKPGSDVTEVAVEL